MTREPPLAGLVVLCLAEQYPGPYATLILADLGAEVILVERPGGDPTRQFPPFYEALNRNKRSVVVDLKAAEGKAAFLRMCRIADVVLEGYRPGVADRLGIGPEHLIRVNPALVYVSISGFGQHGPLRDRPGHDVSYQGLAGMLSDRIGLDAPGLPPQTCYADLASGMFAVISCLAGLHARRRGSTGNVFDVSITDCLISWMTTQLFASANGHPEPGIPPRSEPGFGLFTTLDRKLITLSIAHEDWFWRPLCVALGLDSLVELTIPERAAEFDAIHAQLAAAIGARTLADLAVVLGGAGVPWGPALELEEVLAGEHIQARGLLESVPGPNGVLTTHVRQPIGVWGAGPMVHRPVPALGEHTVEVLMEAGLSRSEADDLVARGLAGAVTPRR